MGGLPKDEAHWLSYCESQGKLNAISMELALAALTGEKIIVVDFTNGKNLGKSKDMTNLLSKYTDQKLSTELADRELKRRVEKLNRYTPTTAEQAAAEREHWYLSRGPGGWYADNGDAHPYYVSEHGRWQSWLDNYRRTHNE